MSIKYILVLLGLLLLAYAGIFVLRGLFGRKDRDFKNKRSMAQDGAQVITGLQKKERLMHQRIEAEHREAEIRARFEAEQGLDENQAATGEHIYPVHTIRQDYLKRVNRVGEEKETRYPQHQQTEEPKEED